MLGETGDNGKRWALPCNLVSGTRQRVPFPCLVHGKDGLAIVPSVHKMNGGKISRAKIIWLFNRCRA